MLRVTLIEDDTSLVEEVDIEVLLVFSPLAADNHTEVSSINKPIHKRI